MNLFNQGHHFFINSLLLFFFYRQYSQHYCKTTPFQPPDTGALRAAHCSVGRWGAFAERNQHLDPAGVPMPAPWQDPDVPRRSIPIISRSQHGGLDCHPAVHRYPAG